MENQNLNSSAGSGGPQSPIHLPPAGNNNSDKGGNKKQALINVGVFIAIFIVLLAGVKLASWSATNLSDKNTEKETEEAVSVSDSTNSDTASSNLKKEVKNNTEAPNVLENKDKSELFLIMSARKDKDTVIREVYFHNPAKNSWVLIYDGYKTLKAGVEPVEVYRHTLLPITYDKIRVRTLEETVELNREINIESGKPRTVTIQF